MARFSLAPCTCFSLVPKNAKGKAFLQARVNEMKI
jgi:hypothetical protein